jgi:hypothetical protein
VQPSSRGGNAVLFVVQVGEEPPERLQGVGDRAAGVSAVIVGQSPGGCFDRVEMVGRPVLGS